MERRHFIKQTTKAAGLSAISYYAHAGHKNNQNSKNKKLLLNAYYFRAHMYTLVPRQIKEDLRWMADIGTDIVSVAILEQDLFAAVENIEIICNEAEKLGISVYAVPSRWGGMVAGAPKVPSLFSIKNPQTWILNKDGSPVESGVSGRISSIHYPETVDFFKNTLNNVFNLWNIKGVIWDEPKTLKVDYSPMALKKLGKDASYEQHIDCNVDFYSEINTHIKSNFRQVTTSLFTYAGTNEIILNKCAQIKNLDYYGCDGRPWRATDPGVNEGKGKVLLGEDAGERFLHAAAAHNKKSLWLIENHNLHDKDIPLLSANLPEVIGKKAEQLIYYYYPRNLQSPDKIMAIMKQHLKQYKL